MAPTRRTLTQDAGGGGGLTQIYATSDVSPRHLRKNAPVDLIERGLPGTKIWAGQISEDPNVALRGLRGLTTYQQMAYEPTCSALLAAHVRPIASTRWFIQPADDSPDALKMADFVHYVLWHFGSQSFDDILRMQLGGMLQYGFAPAEIIWDVIGRGEYEGKWGWDRLAYRSQLSKWRWDVQEINTAAGGHRRELLGMTQLAAPSYTETYIERNKLILHVNELLGENYDGISLFRPCYSSWMYLTTLRRIQAIGLERMYMGIPDVTIPEDWSDSEKAAAMQIAENIRTHENAGVVHPAQIAVQILRTQLEGNAMEKAIADHRRDILQARLSQFLELGARDVGSYALSEDQSDLFLMTLNGTANYFAQEMNLHPGIAQLIDVNFPNVLPEALPKLARGLIGQRNLDRLGRFLNAAGQWGFLTPDNEMEDKLREELEMPERDSTLTDKALVDLVARVNPTEVIPGRRHNPRPLSPAMLEYGRDAQGKPLPTPVPAGGAPGAPGGRQRASVGPRPQVPVGNAAGRQSAAQAQFSEILARAPWPRPRGRLDDETRMRIKASELLVEALEGYGPGEIPERPSIVAAKARQPYVLRGARVQAAEPAALHRREDVPAVRIGQEHEADIADMFRKLKDRPVVKRPGGSTGSRSPVKFSETT